MILNYRRDIDGLRGLSVLIVVLYHCGFTLFSGGFVGVDVFFVISGYLITTIVYTEIIQKKFTFTSFYKRRVVRLLPALISMLVLVLIFGFVFYGNKKFDSLGKDIAFSALGLANILFAQGINYFASEDAYKPLIHMWSLGVEEQFYVVWPFIILIVYKLSKSYVLLSIVCFLLFFMSLVSSEISLSNNVVKGYFYPHYRAFELLIGAGLSFALIKLEKFPLLKYRDPISVLGLLMIVYSSVAFSKDIIFPGVNALIPCIGALLVIAYSEGSIVGRVLSNYLLLFLGTISYPLYLYHQPVLSFIQYFHQELNVLTIFAIVICVSIPLSWFTYMFLEKPLRRMVNENSSLSYIMPITLVVITLVISAIGLYVAKNQGLEWRFKLLNSFSYLVSKQSESTFHENFNRGIHTSNSNDILFIGDSVLQHYIVPISESLDIPLTSVSSVTRGGCVLLKDVDFLDKFSDISCGELRKSIYSNNKVYDRVVISQSWLSYDKSLLNVPKSEGEYLYSLEKWRSYLLATIEYFSKHGSKVILITDHLSVSGTELLQPNIFLNEGSYLNNLNGLKVDNYNEMLENNNFFSDQFSDISFLIHPIDIWCENDCTVHDGTWSFFSDSHHISIASNVYLSNRFESIFSKMKIDSK